VNADTTTRGRRLRGGIIALVILGMMTAAGSYVVVASPLLVVKEISITGVDGQVAQDVRALVNVRRGTPLIHVDSEAIADRVRTIAQVQSVAVRRGWPTTLVVSVVQRTPFAFADVRLAPPGSVVEPGHGFVIVDIDGVVIDSLDKAPPAADRLIRLTTRPDQPGAKVALAATASLPDDVRRRMISVGTASPRSVDSITFTLRNGSTVMWGADELAARKSEVLRALLAQSAVKYDVSAPDLPTAVLR
jgi:cell division protein FtsQ